MSVLEFGATEYGRKGKVVASKEVKDDIENIGINKCAHESGFESKKLHPKADSGNTGETQFV